jgi:hypothetical protein
MTGKPKTKRRGFVMTGGGAKGLYEAGVINAFHVTGMEFDVITGSSIGAMNAIFYAEYLLHKKKLDPKVRDNPEEAIKAMDNLVRAFHHTWLLLPDQRIIDDSESGPIGQLKNNLLRFDVNVPDVTRVAWWATDPDRGSLPGPSVWPAALRLLKELGERIGGADVLRLLRNDRQKFLQQALRTYLARFGIEKSIVPPQDDRKFRAAFSGPVSPLRAEHLQGAAPERDEEQIDLVKADRALKDYADAGIDVRLTRANYRTGRLEVSAYQSTEDFVRYLRRQAWRLQSTDPESVPLASFRLQVPGNPNAVNAALASGRFPAVLEPYPVEQIYPAADPENGLLHKTLANWLSDPEVEELLEEAYGAVSDGAFQGRFQGWRDSENLREFFPHAGDVYIDGGAIDNTPSNSAIDATREWADQKGEGKRDVVLDQYVIFLHPEPKVASLEEVDPYLYETVQRTREMQGVAKQTNDAVVVDTINTFGQKGEDLGESLLIILESLKETLDGMDDQEKAAIETRVLELVRQQEISGYRTGGSDGILERMATWGQKTINNSLPLHVNEIIIYPDAMPLTTLQFTPRLGYRQENAIKMLTMGCYNTLWTLRTRLEKTKRDAKDKQALALAEKWTGIETLPKDSDEREKLGREWKCQRTACVYYAQHCARGAQKQQD